MRTGRNKKKKGTLQRWKEKKRQDTAHEKVISGSA